jgi:hypothetical protein
MESELIKLPLKLFWAGCVTAIFIIVWSVIGWFAIAVLGFFGLPQARFAGQSLYP